MAQVLVASDPLSKLPTDLHFKKTQAFKQTDFQSYFDTHDTQNQHLMP